MSEPTHEETLAAMRLTQQHLVATLNYLSEATTRLDAAITKSWCLLPGDKVIIVAMSGYPSSLVNQGPKQPALSEQVTLQKVVPHYKIGVHWRTVEYPDLLLSEACMRPAIRR